MDLLLLCFEFFKIGIFAIGGGLATMPFLTQLAENYPHWFTLEELTDMIAVSEATPGPIGVNMATYAGFKIAHIPGALIATFSLIIPSFIILVSIARILRKFRENKYISAGFEGLKPAVTGLIAAAAYTVIRLTMFAGDTVFANDTVNYKSVILFAVLFTAMQVKWLRKTHPIIFIAAAAIAGIVFSF
ncbi:MAG: chromate transporter [Oscillospiraceae bacterium]|nr:chromate transporter [Oscillospiraceae bacterium]